MMAHVSHVSSSGHVMEVVMVASIRCGGDGGKSGDNVPQAQVCVSVVFQTQYFS